MTKFLHIHWYRFVGAKGANSYWECRNRYCRKRKVIRGRGWTPVDQGWLDGRESWESPPVSPPPKPSDASRSARP